MKFHTRYNPAAVKGLTCSDPSLAQPQFQADCDINVMIRRALAGDVSVLARGGYNNVDVSDAPESFHEALNKATSADSLWQSLPEQVRATFGSADRLLRAIEQYNAEQALASAQAVNVDKKDSVTAPSGAGSTPASTPSNT